MFTIITESGKIVGLAALAGFGAAIGVYAAKKAMSGVEAAVKKARQQVEEKRREEAIVADRAADGTEFVAG